MKPMALNLSKMKKVAGDKNSSTFLHPGGHRMVIAHNGVSALQRKQLEKMPVQEFAEGGDATLPAELSDLPQEEPKTDNSPFAQRVGSGIRDVLGQGIEDAKGAFSHVFSPPLEAAGDFAKGLLGTPAEANIPESASQLGGSAPSSTQPLPDNSSAELSKPQATVVPQPQDPIAAAYQKGQRSITEQQAVDVAKAKANTQIEEADLQDRQTMNQDFNKAQTELLKHRSDLLDDYAKNHINPDHYVENMGAGQKVATGIGLLLGGFAGGISGQGNPAMDYLKEQINKDIKAQEARQDQQKTILGANEALFHDHVLAQNQTRMNMNDIYDHKIRLAASKQGTPQAKAAADAASAHFTLENAGLLGQSAMRVAVAQQIKSGKRVNAIDLANAGIIPKEEAVKEQASIDAQKVAIQKTVDLFEELNKEQTAGNLINPQSSRRVKALNAELVNAVMNASASKRLTEESVKEEIAPLQIKTTDNDETRKSKAQGLLNIIQRHADPTPYMSRYSPRSLPSYAQTKSNSKEGKPATSASGQKIVMRNGRWVPLGE